MHATPKRLHMEDFQGFVEDDDWAHLMHGPGRGRMGRAGHARLRGEPWHAGWAAHGPEGPLPGPGHHHGGRHGQACHARARHLHPCGQKVLETSHADRALEARHSIVVYTAAKLQAEAQQALLPMQLACRAPHAYQSMASQNMLGCSRLVFQVLKAPSDVEFHRT